ncbi:helix-turn-helix domain-containing protein [Streptomyces sp. NBC_00210]|uniref:helix-turn-helix domain-containing protein n=1 Tax=Streptomyces sp. NBC_00210 TaxID=2903636 RepID=UPI003248A2C4
MRYLQGGGLTAERQEFRERLRLEAAERFGRGESNAVIAKDLRVSVRSVQGWRRTWAEGVTRERCAGPGWPSAGRGPRPHAHPAWAGHRGT